MTPNVKDVINRVLVHEGGIADVGDGKGVTAYGQTPGWLAQWSLPMPHTAERARENYGIWLERVGLDLVCNLSHALGAAAVDWAVNAGHVLPIKALQKALGLTADGVIGDHTRHALLAMTAAGLRRLTVELHAARLEHFGRIITDAPDKHARYAAGWMNRMAKNLRDDLA